MIEAFARNNKKEVKIIKEKGLSKPKTESPYDPEFVKKIRRAEKEESTVIDPNDVWGSLGLR